MIFNIICSRLKNICYINNYNSTAYENVLYNIIHETDIEYLIAEHFFNENKNKILEMVENEKQGKINESN